MANLYANNVTEWFVADSEEDAAALCRQHYKDIGCDADDEESDFVFTRVPDEKGLTMYALSKGRETETTKTAREWADTSPRGFLMTTEY